MTNIKRKEMIISKTKDWPLDPTGTVPKYAFGVTSRSTAIVPLAMVDPNS